MILIASANEALAATWRSTLSSQYSVYEVDVRDRRALELILKKVNFDVLIVDLALLGESGVNEISDLKDIQPNMQIIVMVKAKDEREEISAILFGAKAYCHIDIDLDILPKVVKTVLSQELWVDRKFVTRLLSEIEDITTAKHQEAQQLDKGISAMTPRECQIAQLVATGSSNRKIAQELSISERTVKAHLGVIFRKIGISDRLQLALYMNKHQQLSPVWHGGKDQNFPNKTDPNDK